MSVVIYFLVSIVVAIIGLVIAELYYPNGDDEYRIIAIFAAVIWPATLALLFMTGIILSLVFLSKKIAAKIRYFAVKLNEENK